MALDDGPLTGLVRTAPPPPDRERDALAASVRALLARHEPPAPAVQDAPGQYDEALWARLCDLGVTVMGVPEHHGGAGGDYLDVHAVLVELGRSLVATPLPATVLAAQTVLAAGGALPEELTTATGTLLTGPALSGAAVTATPDVTRPAGYRVSAPDGVLQPVLDGARAEVLIALAALDGGTAVVQVERSAVPATVLATMDQRLHLARLQVHEAPAALLATPDARALDLVHALPRVVLSAEQVGGARRCLDLLVEHVRSRVQFGRAIGSFQAVKHRIADLLVLVEAAESASWSAAQAYATGSSDVALLADIAAATCGSAYLRVVSEAVQLHGGIAITWEHAMHRYFKHAHSTTTVAGPPHAHRALLQARLREQVRAAG